MKKSAVRVGLGLSWLPLVLLSARQAAAAPSDIQIDRSSCSTTQSLASSFTWSHTVGSGSDRLLAVAISMNGNGTPRTIGSVTYGGTALTFAVARDGLNAQRSEIWYLLNPNVGTANIVATVSGGAVVLVQGTGLSAFNVGGYVNGAGNSSATTSANVSVTVSGTATRQLAIDTIAEQGSAVTKGTGQVVRCTGVFGGLNAASSTRAVTSSSVTMSWALSGATAWVTAAAVFRATSTPTAIGLSDVSTSWDGPDLVLRWREDWQARSLGVRVWRELDGTRSPLSDLMPPSAWVDGTQSPAGWFSHRDRGAPVGSRYYLEETDLDGHTTTFGPWEPPSPLHAPLAPSLWRTKAAPNSLDGSTTPQTPAAGAESPAASLVEPQLGGASAPTSELAWWPLPTESATPAAAHCAAQNTAPAVLLRTRAEGFVRVPLTQIETLLPRGGGAGYEVRTADRVVPSHIVSEEGRGPALRFFVRGDDTPWTAERVYWITRARAAQTDEPIPSFPAEANALPRVSVGTAVFEHRPRSLYVPTVLDGAGDNFFGPVIRAVPVSVSLPWQDVSVTHPARLDIQVRAVGTGPHRVHVATGQGPLGAFTPADNAEGATSVVIPTEHLSDASALSLRLASGGATDVNLVRSLRLTYTRHLIAHDETLRARVEGPAELSATGFESSSVQAFDVTDPEAPVRLAVRRRDGAVSVALSAAGPREVVWWGDRAGSVAYELQAYEPQVRARHESAAGGDLLVVTPRAFEPAAQQYARLRRGQGTRAEVAVFEDLQALYACGERTPQALRQYLQARQGAQPRWRSVLLFGSGTFDPRDHLGLHGPEHLPVPTAEAFGIESSWDDWYGDFDEDGVAEIPIGRLPFRTLEEAQSYVAKVASGGVTPTTRRAFVLSGADRDHDFTTDARRPADALAEEGYDVVRWSSTTYSDARTARTEMQRLLGEPSWLTVFLGHGSVDRWSDLLDVPAIGQLAPPEELPVVFAATCLNGLFHDPRQRSVGESLLVARGGARAVVAANASLEGDVQTEVAETFTRAAASGGTLGEAVATAKASLQERRLRRSYTLLGDPSLWSERRRTPPPDSRPTVPTFWFGCGLSHRSPTGWPAMVLVVVLSMWGGRRRRAR